MNKLLISEINLYKLVIALLIFKNFGLLLSNIEKINAQLWFPQILNFSHQVKSFAIKQPSAHSSEVEAITLFDSHKKVTINYLHCYHNTSKANKKTCRAICDTAFVADRRWFYYKICFTN